MIVVTGAAGFIGSGIVARLNELGNSDLLLVDHISDADKLKLNNLDHKKYISLEDKTEFIHSVKENRLSHDIEAVIHMGACSSTILQDADYFRINNFEYTQTLALWCLKNDVRFIYASSAATYGDGSFGYKDDSETIKKCRPLNLYGESKQKFDLWALDQNLLNRMVGLKFFNVFGPNEYHKDDMRSVISKSFDQVVNEGTISLFKSYDELYGDGQQMRDFIYVKDAVEIVLYFLENQNINGIFNAGTGKARSWNDLAKGLFESVNQPLYIDYVDMPEVLKGRYQYFTEADMSKLKASGYQKPFMALEDAIEDYVGYLKNYSYW